MMKMLCRFGVQVVPPVRICAPRGVLSRTLPRASVICLPSIVCAVNVDAVPVLRNLLDESSRQILRHTELDQDSLSHQITGREFRSKLRALWYDIFIGTRVRWRELQWVCPMEDLAHATHASG
jgi:hypothetical protein